ncbi:MAG TPA: methyltransferase [Streptosporangiaceae bacterium]|jgi:ubiquinone/menaquinone biosynthesis C-methylase UbiE
MAYDSDDHYERLAETYERNWANRPQYVTWMADKIMSWLEPGVGWRIADIGSGTGLFLSRLMEVATPETPILCVDPSQPMLDLLPDDPRLTPICATAEQIATGEVPLPVDTVDAFVFKEAIHHVKDIPGTLSGLAARLNPGGRILIVSLPPRLDYPLFQAALDRFAENQPEPDDMAADMRADGLIVDNAVEEFTVTIDRDQWLDLVRNQWMSVLSTFSQEEIAAGVEYISERYSEPQITYVDRFAFVRGIKPSSGGS